MVKKAILIFAISVVMSTTYSSIRVLFAEELSVLSEGHNYAWGKVASNGLQLGIALPKQKYFEKDNFIVHLAMKNTSVVSVATPCRKNWPWMAIRLTVISNVGTRRQGINMGNSIKGGGEFIYLKPGEVIEGDLNVTQGLKGLHPIQNLESGDYKLQASFNYEYAEMIKFEKAATGTTAHTKPAFPEFSGVKGDSGTVPFTVIFSETK